MMKAGLINRVYFLLRPFGQRRLALVLLFSGLQAVLQVVGVSSVFPFFSIATDPEKFRASEIGSMLLRHLPDMSDTELLFLTGAVSLLMLLLSSIISIATQYVRSQYAHGFAHWLRMRMLHQIALQPYEYFVRSNPAILNKKLNADVQQFTAGVLQPLLEVLAGLLAILLLVLTIVFIDPLVSLGALLIVGGFYVIAYRSLSGRRKVINSELKNANRAANSEALNFLNGIKAIKVYGAEKHYTDRYARESHKAAKMSSRLPIYVSIPKHLIEPAVFGALIIYVFAIIDRGESFAASLPVLSVIALAGYRMIPAVQVVYARLSQISAMKHTLEEVFEEIVQIEQFERELIAPRATQPTAALSIDNLEFRSVSFTYPGTGREILDGVDLKLARGEAIAITGPSGSGKSTLIDLMLGLYAPLSGTIAINGKPLSASDLPAYRAGIGYVQQDCFLLNESIRANIAFGVAPGDVDDGLLRDACRKAQILDFITDELEQGFDTNVGDRGIKLSGGQRQRIALARALYRQPEILILDEATSALDTRTESLVTDAIDQLQGRITLVVIAHRSNTIRKIPRKYQLVDGKLALVS